MLSGKWTYRSYLNKTELVGGDANTALNLIFGEGIFEFEAITKTRFRGTLDMGGGYALTLDARLKAGSKGAPVQVAIVGEGIGGSPTAGWQYDYRAILAYRWPEGINQVPCLVGTVIRVKAHGPKSPAGFTASFVAVSHGDGAAA